MKTILLAEDEGIIALALKKGLETLGYKVLKRVSTGRELIEMSLILKPDIIVTDINLKDSVTGLEAISRIRPELQAVFIVITGYNDPGTVEEIRKTNPHFYLPKPVSSTMIRDAIEGRTNLLSIETYERT